MPLGGVGWRINSPGLQAGEAAWLLPSGGVAPDAGAVVLSLIPESVPGVSRVS